MRVKYKVFTYYRLSFMLYDFIKNNINKLYT